MVFHVAEGIHREVHDELPSTLQENHLWMEVQPGLELVGLDLLKTYRLRCVGNICGRLAFTATLVLKRGHKPIYWKLFSKFSNYCS
jgi:hypothetical protein